MAFGKTELTNATHSLYITVYILLTPSFEK